MATRLAWGFGAVLAVLLLALALAALQLRSVYRHNARLTEDQIPRLLRVQTLALSTEGTANALLTLMNVPRAQREPVYAQVDATNRQIDGIVEVLAQQFDDAAQRSTLEALMAARTRYKAAFLATVDEVEADNVKAAMQAYSTQVRPALADLLRASQTLLNRERDRLTDNEAAALAHIETLLQRLAVLAALAVGLAASVAWRTSRAVVQPMRALQATASRIAQGDYQAAAMPAGPREVVQVGAALHTMTQAIAERERVITRLAFEDPATGLPNRNALLRQGRDPCGRNAMLLADLARMKTINAALGYELGDALIAEVARRARVVLAHTELGGCAPAFLSRVTGASFALWVRADTPEVLRDWHVRLVQACAQPAQCDGQEVDLQLICGAVCGPTDAPEPVDRLLLQAEAALAQAKTRAEPLAWFDVSAAQQQRAQLNLLSDLRHAIDHDELQMWLQPKFSLKNGQAIATEALVRWQHPQRGFISPAEFVPFAERTGAIRDVTDWMVRRALATLRDWQARGIRLGLSVNMTTRDLQRPNWDAQVGQWIAQAGIDPSRLTLEVVESGLMEDPASSVALLHRLRALGVRLSIDDFGTGYSSLAYVQRLPVHELKIDRSFVTNLAPDTPGARLVQTMVDMGHALGLEVTAEGVETVQERDTLIALGADVMQGYLASRPLHGAVLADWLDAQLR